MTLSVKEPMRSIHFSAPKCRHTMYVGKTRGWGREGGVTLTTRKGEGAGSHWREKLP